MGSPLALKVTADHSGQPFEMWEKKKEGSFTESIHSGFLSYWFASSSSRKLRYVGG